MIRLIIIFFLIPVLAVSQTSRQKYFVTFTDKKNNAFTISQPEEFLSARAIERRTKQNIQVKLEDLPVNENYISSVQMLGANLLAKSKWLNGILIECDSVVNENVRLLPFVNGSLTVFRKSVPRIRKSVTSGVPLSPASLLKITGVNYGPSFNQINLMHAEFLHEHGYTGGGMLIAVLDAGFYSVDQLSMFDSLREQNRILSTWDFVDNEASVYEDDTHGMSVLSTIAGNIPGLLVGTAPHASFILLRSEDGSSENIIEEYNWAAAAEYADSAGADVISSSLGYTTFDDSTANHTYAEMDGDHAPSTIAADIAASKGILVINSAGNSGAGAWHYIGAPSDGDSVMSIAAVDSVGHHAFFSSFGPAPDGRIKPNVAAKGYQSTIANSFGGISKANGTSFACPILAGAASCLWQKYRSASAAEIKSAIEKSGNYYQSPNDSLGYGIPDFRIAGFFLSSGISGFPAGDEVIGIYPNPFSKDVNIRFYSVKTQEVIVEMFTSIGQIVYSKTGNAVAENINTFTISPSGNFGAGIYFIKLTTSERSYVKTVFMNR